MPLPPVAFFSIYEIAVRWGCPPADVAGWAAAGHLHVVAGIPPVLCGDETVAGMVQVPIAELMGMFRRMGPSDDQARLKRVMPLGSKTWLKITDPAEGLLVRSSDLLLDSGTLQAFDVNRRAKLTPYRRPKLTPLVVSRSGPEPTELITEWRRVRP